MGVALRPLELPKLELTTMLHPCPLSGDNPFRHYYQLMHLLSYRYIYPMVLVSVMYSLIKNMGAIPETPVLGVRDDFFSTQFIAFIAFSPS